jgi:hypothetical protein
VLGGRSVAVLTIHVEMLDHERKEFGPDYHDLGLLFCWEDGRPHPDTITSRFKKLSRNADLPDIDLRDVRRSYLTAGRKARIDWKPSASASATPTWPSPCSLN